MGIAFDAGANGGIVNPGTSRTWSHTCAGNNRYLLVGTIGDNVSDLITGVTYNSVAMSKLNVVQIPSDRFLTLWGLAAPATGSNSVVATASSSIVIAGVSASYTGVASVETTATNTTSGSTEVTGTVTTTAANCWTAATFADDLGGPLAAATGTTSRIANGSTGLAMMDSNTTLTPGSRTLQATGTTTGARAVVIASLAPATPLMGMQCL